MQGEFYRTYELLYSDYLYEQDRGRVSQFYYQDEHYLLRIIREAIDSNGRRGDGSDKSLRPDARYFLLVNFHQMIVRPLLDYRFPNERSRPYDGIFDDLREAIRDDIDTLINFAKQRSDETEISGHQMMSAIDLRWRDLRTTRFEIWG